jgi:hypothetical protein
MIYFFPDGCNMRRDCRKRDTRKARHNLLGLLIVLLFSAKFPSNHRSDRNDSDFSHRYNRVSESLQFFHIPLTMILAVGLVVDDVRYWKTSRGIWKTA